MADTSTAKAAREAGEALGAESGATVASFGESMRARASHVAEDAEDAFNDLRSGATEAMKKATREARAVSRTVGEHPGAAATVLSSAGLMGIAIGFFAGYLIASSKR